MWEPTYFYPFTYQASGGEGRGRAALDILGASPRRKPGSCSAVGSQRLDGAREYHSGLVVVFDLQDFPLNTHRVGYSTS